MIRVLLCFVMGLLIVVVCQGVADRVGRAAQPLAEEIQVPPVPNTDQQSKATTSPMQAPPVTDSHADGHVDLFSFVMLELAVVILLAMLGRWAAGRLNQPSVLGELLSGVVIGNLLYWLDRPVATLVMHMGEAGKIFREVWDSGLSVSEAARKVLPSTELGPEGVGSRVLQLAQRIDFLNDGVVDQDGTGESLPAMDNSMANSFDL